MSAPVPPVQPVSSEPANLPNFSIPHKAAFLVFLGGFGVSFCLSLLAVRAAWADGFLVLSAAATLSIGLARRLPAQNVAALLVLIGLVSGAAVSFGEFSGIPFGPFKFSPLLREASVLGLPWPIPFLWIALILAARGTARLIARPWRKTLSYGFWVIGISAGLASATALGLEPYAAAARHYWRWDIGPAVWDWQGTPWTDFVGCALLAAAILVFGTPWFINKKPVKQPADYHPLAVWLLLETLFCADAAVAGRLAVLWASIPIATLTAALAVRGARW